MPRLCFVTICVLALTSLVHAGPKDQKLDIYWVDVEGGAATLLVTPTGESVLIDSGNPGRRDSDRIVRVLTEQAGLRRIDHLVVTHYHGDHYGGAATLATLIPIGTVYDNGEFTGMPERPEKSYREFKCDKRVVINPGDELSLKKVEDEKLASLEIKCIATRGKFIDIERDIGHNRAVCESNRPKDRDGSDNANSVVLRVRFGDFCFFDAGDLTWNMEYNLVCPANRVGKVDVYQVTHHGLDQSNNPVVLATLQPRVAIMNNGVRKGCDPEVVTTLRATKSLEAVYQLHKNLRPDGKAGNVADEFIANLEEKCAGNHVVLSVDPDGKNYTVRIPAAKHEKRYATR